MVTRWRLRDFEWKAWTYISQLVLDGLDSPRDVVVQRRMPGLKHGRFVLFPSDKDLGGVDLSNIENGVDGHLDYGRLV